jgi:xylulokinase
VSPLVAGVDCSTQATKVLVVDSDGGEVVAEGRAPHDVSGRGGARETNPEEWWEALRTALGETGRAAEVAAISVAGQQHGLVVMDSQGRPLRPAILWNDTRSAQQARELRSALGGPSWWAEEIGVVPVPSFTATRWKWLQANEPDLAGAAAAVRLPHDFVTERLCGRAVTDRGDASGTAWWSTRDETYSGEVLDHVGLDRSLLPDVLGPSDRAGEVSASAAGHLGLAEGALVGPGTGDNMGAALGLGAAAGEPVVSLGTSGTAYAVMEQRAVDPSGTVAGFADAGGGFLPLAATLNATQAVDRFAEWLGLDREAAAERTEAVVLPYLDGERTPDLPRAAGMVAGLRHHTTREEILLAAYEGAAASLIEALDELARQGSGLDPDAPLILIGGGARGAVWQRVVARLSGRRVLVPKADELVALGAAAQAAGALEDEAAADVARRWDTRAGITIDPPAEPDRETLARIRSARDASLRLHEP